MKALNQRIGSAAGMRTLQMTACNFDFSIFEIFCPREKKKKGKKRKGGHLLIDPAVTGLCTGKLKTTVRSAAQPTTVALASQPNFPRLKRLALGRYLGSRDRYMSREAGKAKEMSSVTMAVPMKTLKAGSDGRVIECEACVCVGGGYLSEEGKKEKPYRMKIRGRRNPRRRARMH